MAILPENTIQIQWGANSLQIQHYAELARDACEATQCLPRGVG